MAFKHLLPFVIKKQFNKHGGSGGFFGGQNPFGNQEEQHSEDKTIKVDYAPKSENDGKTDGLGDYIEYEEVKD